MVTLVRSELHRMATIRSSWASIVLFGAVAAAFGVLEAHWWALFAGIGAFAIAVLTVTQHYQHRTITLLYLARPKRGGRPDRTGPHRRADRREHHRGQRHHRPRRPQQPGLPEQRRGAPEHPPGRPDHGGVRRRPRGHRLPVHLNLHRLRPLGHHRRSHDRPAEWPLPISSFLDAAKSRPDPFSLMIFSFWTLAALAVAIPMLDRDLNSD